MTLKATELKPGLYQLLCLKPEFRLTVYDYQNKIVHSFHDGDHLFVVEAELVRYDDGLKEAKLTVLSPSGVGRRMLSDSDVHVFVMVWEMMSS
mgnify:FL=1